MSACRGWARHEEPKPQKRRRCVINAHKVLARDVKASLDDEFGDSEYEQYKPYEPDGRRQMRLKDEAGVAVVAAVFVGLFALLAGLVTGKAVSDKKQASAETDCLKK